MVAVFQRRLVFAVLTSVVLVALSSLWWGLGAETRFGLPTPTTIRALRHSLQAAHPLLVGFHLPLAHSPGIVILCALISGLAAVGARAVGTRYPALSIAPPAAILVWSAILLPRTEVAVAGLVLGVCGFLVLPNRWRTVGRPFLVVAGVSIGAAALTLTWTVSGTGSGAASPGGLVVPAVAPTALSLASNLTELETKDANVVLFQAATPVSTYWQVTSLTIYANNQWVPDAPTQSILDGSTPASLPITSNNQQLFSARISLASYRGTLVPAPPSTVSAVGGGNPVVTVSGVAATSPLASGTSYTATAVVPKAVVDSQTTSEAPPSDVALGAIPASIRSLALSITTSQPGLLGKAEALTDYFRSGRFHYTVNPPTPAAGSDPLITFLTQTRTGSCEQFAGAFAVLARAAGLPTRVAIGFTPGQASNGVITVRGSDAHSWPEVLINGSWVSFEPTPQLPSGELSPPGVLGPAALGTPNPPSTPTVPHTSVPVPTTPTATVPPAATPSPSIHQSADGDAVWWIAAGVFAILVPATGAVAFWRRRRSPRHRLVASWVIIDRALSRRGTERPRSRTPAAHIKALSTLEGGDQYRATLRDMATVADLLEKATYGRLRLTAEDAEHASRASRRARRAILGGTMSGASRRNARNGRSDHPQLTV
jgi:transglutaminase-like putative cysteine protease